MVRTTAEAAADAPAVTTTAQEAPEMTTPAAAPRTWFITGATRGLGRALTEAVLAAGERVVAAARDTSPLDALAAEHPGRLLTLPLDIADREAVHRAVDRAVAWNGRLDMVVNNAGGLLFGMVEEATEEQIRRHLDVNLLGAVWVCQAVIPHLREQGGGRIWQVTSMGSSGGFPSVGYYAAGKAALDSVSDAMAQETARFGIRTTIVQPGGYATDLFTSGTTATAPDPRYDALRAELAEFWGTDAGPDPATAVPALLELADLEEPPARLIVGSASYDLVMKAMADQADAYRAWEDLSRRAPG